MKQPAEIVKDFINQTKKSIFLTGKAGTGKTTLLNEIKELTLKQTVVVAPTGIAALNAGGVTIHSMFQLPFAAFIPEHMEFQQLSAGSKFESKTSLMRHFQMNKKRLELLRNLELLIIDEVSMLRADLLDAIDWLLRNIRKHNAPFGGVQVLFIGDLLQLPPVVKQEEWSVLQKYYEGIYFFNAHALKENPPIYIELDKIYRQNDDTFIQILNNLRENSITEADKIKLNEYADPSFDSTQTQGYITLTTHNYKADEINQKQLAHLDSKSISFQAEIKGDFPPHLYPIETELVLKKGAQVMFIKNDISPDKLYYNGKMGIVKEVNQGEISIEFPEEKRRIEVEKYEWENIRYSVDEKTKEITEETIGTFVQYPLKLAWAITVHKSQGLTFEKAAIDVSDAFAPGQAYVALSRLRSLKGLVLLKPFALNSFQSNKDVLLYSANKLKEEQLDFELNEATKWFINDEVILTFNFSDLAAKWRLHNSTYSSLASKSEKAKHTSWALHQTSKIERLVEPGQKFQQQISRIVTNPQCDFNYLFERVEAAYSYFSKDIEELFYLTLKKIEEVKRVPKIKTFIEELVELDELLTDKLIQLRKIKLITTCLANDKPIEKSSVLMQQALAYKQDRLTAIRAELNQSKTTFTFDNLEEIEEEVIDLNKANLQPVKAESKIASVDQTLALLHSKKTISEIAVERLLSEGTIYSHITQLIKAKKVELNEILRDDKIIALEKAFEGFDGGSLSPIKDKFGDDFSWEELRMYKTYVNR